MDTSTVTFGWVVSPSTSLRDGQSPGAATTSLLAQDRAFIDELPHQFTTLWVEDHFQWGSNPTLECFTTLTYLAALYQHLQIGSIVLGQSYRNPALTAKMAATLQALTGGRFILGLGAGWKQDEYEAYGYDYPSAGTRIDQLDEALQIVKTMFSQSPASFAGRYYRVDNAYCEPRPQQPIPLLIGGSGEQKTLRVVAKHADLWNGNFTTSDTYARKLAVLAEHCRDIGRDPSEIVHTYYAIVDLSDAQDAAARTPTMHILDRTAEDVAAELRAFIGLGVRHFMLRFTDFPSRTGLQRFTREVLPALDLT